MRSNREFAKLLHNDLEPDRLDIHAEPSPQPLPVTAFYGDADDPKVSIKSVLPQELETIGLLYVPPPTYQQAKELIVEKHLLILYGPAEHGKYTTALQLLSVLHGQKCFEMVSDLNWAHLDATEVKPNTGYLIDNLPVDNANKLTSFMLRRLSRIFGDVDSHLIITLDSRVPLSTYSVRDYLCVWDQVPDRAQVLQKHLNWSLPNPEQRQKALALCQREEVRQILATKPLLADIARLAELLIKVVCREDFDVRQALDEYQANAAQRGAVTPTSIQGWQHYAGDIVADVSVSDDGRVLIAGTLSKTVLSFSENGELRWQRRVGNQARRTALSADGQTIVVGTGSTRFWDRRGHGLFCFAKDGSLRWHQELGATTTGLSVSRDGNIIAVGTDGNQLLIKDSEGNCLWAWSVPAIAVRWSTVCSRDGQLLIAGGSDKRIQLLDRRGNLRAEHQARGDVHTVTASADGTILSAGDSEGFIYLFDQHGDLLWEKELPDKVSRVKLRGDGKRLFVGTDEKEGHLTVYDQRGQKLWQRLIEAGVSSLDVSHDGQRIALGTSSGAICIFDGAGKLLYQRQAQKQIRDIAISATGETIIAGSEDGFVYGFTRSVPR